MHSANTTYSARVTSPNGSARLYTLQKFLRIRTAAFEDATVDRPNKQEKEDATSFRTTLRFPFKEHRNLPSRLDTAFVALRQVVHAWRRKTPGKFLAVSEHVQR